MRFAARHFSDPVIHVTRDPDARTVTFWVDDSADPSQWASLTLTRSDLEGLAREFGCELDDAPEATPLVSDLPRVTAEPAPDDLRDADGPDVILGGEG